MTIASLSISYRTAPARALGQLAVPRDERSSVLAQLRKLAGIDEVFLLSTCNRVEVYAATQLPVPVASAALAGALADRAGMPVDDVRAIAHILVDEAAVEHLFAVTCGLESMAVGEDQIVAQVKAAGRDATATGTTGPVLSGLLEAALRASKRARCQTTIGTAGISLARVGLRLAGSHFGGELTRRHAVVVGTGTMGRLAARLLCEAGVGRLSILSRNETRAVELAASVGGRALAAADLIHAIGDADILIAATTASTPIVRVEDVRTARHPSRPGTLFIVDLGVPPNVEAEVRQVSDVILADVGALSRHPTAADVQDQIPQARDIITAEVTTYLARQEQAAVSPVISALHARIRHLADTELARLQDRLPGLDDQQRAETSETVHRILRKVVHQPTVRVKQLGTGANGPLYLEALRQLFDLPPPV
jgi:glutamyl-tRNA reductase